MSIGAISSQNILEFKVIERKTDFASSSVSSAGNQNGILEPSMRRVQQSQNSSSSSNTSKENINHKPSDVSSNVESLSRAAESNVVDSKSLIVNQRRFDEYIKGAEQADGQKPGLYSLEKDESGNDKVVFDKPEENVDKTAQSKQAEQTENKDDSSKEEKKEVKKTTISTDKIEAHIRELKDEKRRIQRMLVTIDGDRKKESELQKQLSSINTQIRNMSGESYKRQHAEVVYS